jgi:acetoin utilization deacetylase AcuC-like enzyme
MIIFFITTMITSTRSLVQNMTNKHTVNGYFSRKGFGRSITSASTGTSASVRFFYNDVYRVVLPNNHRFPMSKYRHVRDLLEEELYIDGKHENVEFHVSPLATYEEICTTHCPRYVSRFFNGKMTHEENRRIGFPWSISGVQRVASSVGGTVASMRSVCDGSVPIAAHLAGGTHHAFYDRGEGFCVFSDIAVAANLALNEYNNIKKIMIIDLDVHQGNGNAVLFANNDQVFTFSMHCIGNYFSKKRSSDLDIEVNINNNDGDYLHKLSNILQQLFDNNKPDLIFYQAGVDGLENDRLGKLKLSQDGLIARNRMVYDTVEAYGAKLVVTMGGGYPKDLDTSSKAYRDVIRAHVNVYKDCIR